MQQVPLTFAGIVNDLIVVVAEFDDCTQVYE